MNLQNFNKLPRILHGFSPAQNSPVLAVAILMWFRNSNSMGSRYHELKPLINDVRDTVQRYIPLCYGRNHTHCTVVVTWDANVMVLRSWCVSSWRRISMAGKSGGDIAQVRNLTKCPSQLVLSCGGLAHILSH